MTGRPNRRDVLKGAAAAGAFLRSALAQPAARVAGRDVQVRIETVSPETLRLTISPVADGAAVPVLDDGALVQPSWPVSAPLRRGARQTFRSGNLQVDFD